MSSIVRRASWALSLVGAVALGAVAPSIAAESVIIQRKLNPKQVRYIESDTDITQKISGMNMPGGGGSGGGEMEMKIKQITGVMERIEEGKLGKKVIKYTFERTMQSMDMPMMGLLEFDSDDPDNEDAAPQFAQIYQPMVGESFTVEVTRDYKVVNFSGMDAIGKKVSEKATGNMFWPQMKPRYTDKKARREWGEDRLSAYPNKEVKVGDSWTAESEEDDPQLGLVVRKSKYTLEKIGKEDGREVAYISSMTDISKGEGGEGDASKTKISGKSSGKAVYDVELGAIVRQDGESDMKIKMVAQGQNLDVNVVSKTTTRMLTEAERQKQKEETAAKIAERKKAEEAEDEEDEEDEEEDEEDEEDSDDEDE